MSVSPPVRENESRISFDDYSFVLSFHLERAIQVILEGGQFIHFRFRLFEALYERLVTSHYN